MTSIQIISQKVAAPAQSIQNTLSLLQDDCTIPIIARYRKDTTDNLDETRKRIQLTMIL